MGEGERKTIVMVHGWPDTARLWQPQIEVLRHRYDCVAITLPGFEATEERPLYSFEQVLAAIGAAVGGKRVTLLLHDWGCFFGYQFALRHPQLVERVVGVDVGDAGSRSHLAELGMRGKLAVFAYQLWLALAWRMGGRVGDAMARGMARLLRCPTNPKTIRAQMGYPYALRWLGVGGGFRGVRVFEPGCPMLFIYGEKKPLMFHSRAWATRVAAVPGNRVIGMPTGHWIMVTRRDAFNQALRTWLAETDRIA